MASWSELLNEYKKAGGNPNWLDDKLCEQLRKIKIIRKASTVIFYASSFLQKPTGNMSIAREDLNGFMNALYKVSAREKLTLILHTPGGDPNAVESIVEYLHSKFNYIEVIVPYLAMSGGAMISLASDLLIIGKQSQLGPIDPQMLLADKIHSAKAIQESFNKAKDDIISDIKLAHLWAPILQNMGPSLFIEAEKALSYSKELVTKWLTKRMLKNETNKDKANKITAYFNAEPQEEIGQVHMHGQRIGVEKLIELGIEVESLEANQDLQNNVLIAYHIMTLIFENSPTAKFITSDSGKVWAKSITAVPLTITAKKVDSN